MVWIKIHVVNTTDPQLFEIVGTNILGCMYHGYFLLFAFLHLLFEGGVYLFGKPADINELNKRYS